MKTNLFKPAVSNIKSELKPLSNKLYSGLKNHVQKSKSDNKFDVRILLYSSAGLELYSNLMDSVNFRHNKNVSKEKRNYICSYKITNGIVSSILQVISGLIVLNDKVQKTMAKKLFAGVNPASKEFANCTKGLRAFSTIVRSAVLVQRMLTPFIVTPLTCMFNKKLNNKRKSSIKTNPVVENYYYNRIIFGKTIAKKDTKSVSYVA